MVFVQLGTKGQGRCDGQLAPYLEIRKVGNLVDTFSLENRVGVGAQEKNNLDLGVDFSPATATKKPFKRGRLGRGTGGMHLARTPQSPPHTVLGYQLS